MGRYYSDIITLIDVQGEGQGGLGAQQPAREPQLHQLQPAPRRRQERQHGAVEGVSR